MSEVYLGIAADRTGHLDVALWLASFSYLGAIIWSRYLERGLLRGNHRHRARRDPLGGLGAVVGTLVVGAWLAQAYLRIREPRVISGLRVFHTGSANDHADYAIAGTLAVITVLGLA
jgi:hypothetical protein